MWCKVQEILDSTEWVTNTSGSTKRKHSGSGLCLCAVCGVRVRGAARGYRCAGHVMRTGPVIDEFVTAVIAKRLSSKDVKGRILTLEDSPQNKSIEAAISDQRARIMRAQADYDGEIIEGRGLKRVRDAAESRM